MGEPRPSLRQRASASLRGGWRRFVVLALAGVVGAYVLYLIVANGLLWAQVMPGYLEDEEETVRIHYRSAWTLWPGRVAAEDLRVAHQDSGLQSEFRARAATASIGLLDLLSKRVVFSDLVAREVSVRVRGRRPEMEAVAAQDRLPPMLQWGSLAIEDPGPKTQTDPDRLWHVVLEDTRACAASSATPGPASPSWTAAASSPGSSPTS